MNKILTIFFYLFFYINNATAKNINIFSVSSDWEKLTGLRFKEYDVETDIKNTKEGYYYMDSFPCYGIPDNVYISNKNSIKIVCLKIPKKLFFVKYKTKEIFECPNEKTDKIKIDFNNCINLKD